MDNKIEAEDLPSVLVGDPYTVAAYALGNSDGADILALTTEQDGEERDVLDLYSATSSSVGNSIPESINNGKGSCTDLKGYKYSDYTSLQVVGRCVHLDDARDIFTLRALIPHPLYRKPIPELNSTQVLWTEPSKPAWQHNIFGNVTFSIEWHLLLQYFGPYLYRLAQRDNGHNLVTEMLLTKRSYPRLQLVNLNSCTSPMRRSQNGSSEFASKVQTHKGLFHHRVQIAVESTVWEGMWFYAVCNIEANEHKEGRFCFRSNYVARSSCTFNMGREGVEETLARYFGNSLSSVSRENYYDAYRNFRISLYERTRHTPRSLYGVL